MSDIQINDHSQEVLNALDDAIKRGLIVIGMAAEGDAKKLCPTKSGLLKNSITHALSGDSFNHSYSSKDGKKTGSFNEQVGDKDEKAVYIGTNVEYAAYVEMGTSRTDPQPFLKPAVTDNMDKYKKILEAEIKNALKD